MQQEFNYTLSVEVQSSLQNSLGHFLVSAYEAAAGTDSPIAAVIIPGSGFAANQSVSGLPILSARVTLVNYSPPRVRWEVADASTCLLDTSRSECRTAAVLWHVETDAGASRARLDQVETAVAIQAPDGSTLATTGLVAALTVKDMLGEQSIASIEGLPCMLHLMLGCCASDCVLTHRFVSVPPLRATLTSHTSGIHTWLGSCRTALWNGMSNVCVAGSMELQSLSEENYTWWVQASTQVQESTSLCVTPILTTRLRCTSHGKTLTLWERFPCLLPMALKQMGVASPTWEFLLQSYVPIAYRYHWKP